MTMRWRCYRMIRCAAPLFCSASCVLRTETFEPVQDAKPKRWACSACSRAPFPRRSREDRLASEHEHTERRKSRIESRHERAYSDRVPGARGRSHGQLGSGRCALGLDDGLWNEWRGPNDDRPPRKLTLGELSRLPHPFGIRLKTIWPARRRPGDKSGRGYLRSQFEKAWHAYCPSPDTPTQPSKIIRLPRP